MAYSSPVASSDCEAPTVANPTVSSPTAAMNVALPCRGGRASPSRHSCWRAATSHAAIGSSGSSPEYAARQDSTWMRPIACASAAVAGRTVGIARTLACDVMRFEHVLVVGAGQMGGGIAQVVAASGRRVSLHDEVPGATDRAVETMRKSLAKLAEKGGAAPDDVLARVSAVDEVVPADLMVEAVVEDADVKLDVFRRADATLPPEAVLASNTSSIPISSLAAATGRPDRVIGMHFFNPVPVLKLVEVVRGRDTSDETTSSIVELAKELGKVPAEANDFPGYVDNRILMPFSND